jgi:Family of unknown function (DUF6169)
MNNNDIYDFSFAGGGYNSYFFANDSKIVYQIKFRDTAYIFDGYLDFEVSAFEMIIQVEANPTGKNPPLDVKIPATIASIFKDFFKRIPKQVIIYICDSSDARQAARKRKFDQWIEAFKGEEFSKVDSKIEDFDGRIYYNTLIIRRSNPNYIAITDAFIAIAEEQDK